MISNSWRKCFFMASRIWGEINVVVIVVNVGVRKWTYVLFVVTVVFILSSWRTSRQRCLLESYLNSLDCGGIIQVGLCFSSTWNTLKVTTRRLTWRNIMRHRGGIVEWILVDLMDNSNLLEQVVVRLITEKLWIFKFSLCLFVFFLCVNFVCLYISLLTANSNLILPPTQTQVHTSAIQILHYGIDL